MRHVRLFLCLLIPALALWCASVASAAKYVTVKGAPAPGPKAFDKVFVEKHGSKRADTVLVLIPGTGGGAGSVAPIARDLSKGVEGLQVWSFDRRSQNFEDTSGFKARDAGVAADYYLNFRYDRVTPEEAPRRATRTSKASS